MKDYILPETLAVSHTCYPDGRQTSYDEGMIRRTWQDFSHVAKKAYKEEADRIRSIKTKMRIVKSKIA